MLPSAGRVKWNVDETIKVGWELGSRFMKEPQLVFS